MQCIPVSNLKTIFFQSEAPLEKIKKGDFIIIQHSHLLHQISTCEKVSFEFEASLEDKQWFIIKEKLNNIFPGDNLKIIFNAFEIDCVLIKEPGTLFKEQTPISVDGENAKLVINKVDHFGRIGNLKIEKRGCFTSGKNKTLLFRSNEGKDSRIEVIFRPIGKRTHEIVADSIFWGENYTKIFSNGFELNLTDEFSIFYERYQMTLSSEFPVLPNMPCNFSLFSEYTNFLSLPFLAENNVSPEILINRNLSVLDAKMQEIDERIRKLENK